MEEEALSLIRHGCKLARDLESNLSNLSNQPIFLASSCDDIAKAFKTAMDRLHPHNPSSDLHLVFREPQQPPALDACVQGQEWIRTSYPQAVDLVQARFIADRIPFDGGVLLPESRVSTELGVTVMDYAKEAEGSARSKSGGERHGAEESDSGKNPAVQKLRRRKDGVETRYEAAPRMGNTEIPPDDGYTWRKYGQKEILGSKFPRSYYRCTHKSFYGCNAKKQVQRLDDDPNTFQVTYYGVHTCHMSSTAPSSGSGGPLSITTTTTITDDHHPLPLPLVEVLQIQSSSTQPPTNYSSSSSSSIPIPLSRWIFMGFEATPTPSRRNTTMAIGDGGGGGGAATRDSKETVECPVMDLADAMFNSGSSTSNNSMDSIFPSMHE